MNKEEFIKAIKTSVCDSVPNDIDTQLKHPLMKKNEEFKTLSEWYANLNPEEKQMVFKIIQLATNSSVFGFLCVLDGVRAIEDSNKKGNLELVYSKNNERVVLNEEKGMYLHDVFSM